MLIDSGASGNFITQKFIDAGRETLNACLTGIEPKIVKLANGSTIKNESNVNRRQYKRKK